jgi:hypothetical protein
MGRMSEYRPRTIDGPARPAGRQKLAEAEPDRKVRKATVRDEAVIAERLTGVLLVGETELPTER